MKVDRLVVDTVKYMTRCGQTNSFVSALVGNVLYMYDVFNSHHGESLQNFLYAAQRTTFHFHSFIKKN
jgi:hypothetical protein